MSKAPQVSPTVSDSARRAREPDSHSEWIVGRSRAFMNNPG